MRRVKDTLIAMLKQAPPVIWAWVRSVFADRSLRWSAIFSLGLHMALLIGLVVGLPYAASKKALDISHKTVIVDVVNISDITNLPKAAAKPEPKPKPKPKPKPEPKPEPKKEPLPLPPPPKPKAPAEVKKPEPKPQPPKPEEKPAEKPPEKPKEPEKPKPKEEPKEPVPEKAPLLDKSQKETEDDFLSVLDTVEELETQQQEATEDAVEEALAALEVAPGVSTQPGDITQPLSVSQIDAIRRQIEKCWNMPAGARYAENLQVELVVELDPSGKVRAATPANVGSDPFQRAAAESAQRALLNPQCNQFDLPEESYTQWKTLRLTFDPSEMLGY